MCSQDLDSAFSFVNWTDCHYGTFGNKCENNCHCLDQATCDKLSGHCASGCQAGWTGDDCQQSKAIYTYDDILVISYLSTK